MLAAPGVGDDGPDWLLSDMWWVFCCGAAHLARAGERPVVCEHARSAKDALDAGMKSALSPR